VITSGSPTLQSPWYVHPCGEEGRVGIASLSLLPEDEVEAEVQSEVVVVTVAHDIDMPIDSFKEGSWVVLLP
jgi:hypothetical protein